MVEFALVLPVLLMLILGGIELGRGLHLKSLLTHASREGARAAAVGNTDAEQVTIDATGGLDPAQLVVTINPDPCVAGDPVTVTVSYPFSYSIPFVTDATTTIVETGTMRCGG